MTTRKRNILPKESWRRLRELFDEASLLTGAERERFLAALSHSEPTIYADLVSLLAHESSGSSPLDRPLGLRLDDFVSSRGPELDAGSKLRDFSIEGVLGRGGFATVYRARQLSLGREVALKVSTRGSSEGRLMASMEHENIVRVFSQEYDPEMRAWLTAMQYVAGPTLERLRSGADEPLDGAAFLERAAALTPAAIPLDPIGISYRERLAAADVVELTAMLGIRLAEALAYAHGRGVLHLDVKPANILIDAYGRAFLADFNVSVRPSPTSGGPTVLGGTVAYMAPEQARWLEGAATEEGHIDGRADIFSLGRVLERWLGGGDKEGSLRAILRRCAETDRAQRYANASDLARALRGYVARRRLRRALPAEGPLLRLGARYPLVTLTLLGALPQFLATALGVYYNFARILSMLGPAQREAFRGFLWIYLPIAYALGTAVWAAVLRRLAHDTRAFEGGHATEDAAARIRHRVMTLPRWMLSLTILAWAPGSILCPLAIEWATGPLPISIYGHFALSFGLSSVIALAYSHSIAQHFCTRVLYTRFWTPDRATVPAELRRLRRGLLLFPLLTCVVPLVAALGLTALGLPVYAPVVFTLVLMGITGVLFSLPMTQRLAQTLEAIEATIR